MDKFGIFVVVSILVSFGTGEVVFKDCGKCKKQFIIVYQKIAIKTLEDY